MIAVVKIKQQTSFFLTKNRSRWTIDIVIVFFLYLLIDHDSVVRFPKKTGMRQMGHPICHRYAIRWILILNQLYRLSSHIHIYSCGYATSAAMTNVKYQLGWCILANVREKIYCLNHKIAKSVISRNSVILLTF